MVSRYGCVQPWLMSYHGSLTITPNALLHSSLHVYSIQHTRVYTMYMYTQYMEYTWQSKQGVCTSSLSSRQLTSFPPLPLHSSQITFLCTASFDTLPLYRSSNDTYTHVHVYTPTINTYMYK